MREPLVRPCKAAAGDKVAVLSPSFAAPALAPQVHDQAMTQVRHLRAHGPTLEAFTFRNPFPAPDQPGSTTRTDDDWLCPA